MLTNCQNCSAPLTLAAYQDQLRCDYCETLHFPSLREDRRIERLDAEPSSARCPTCATRLSHAQIGRWRFVHCSACRGMLIDGDDLLEIVAYCRREAEPVVREPTPIDPEALSRRIACPDCGETMSAHPYYGPGQFVIDSCGDCRRVWLDAGELMEASEAPWAGSLWR